MNPNKIPPEHAAQVLEFLRGRSTAEVVDLIELATSVFAHGQTVYNFHIPGNRAQTQTFYVQDAPAMFEELRSRLPIDDIQMLRSRVETPSVRQAFKDHVHQTVFQETLFHTSVAPYGDKEH